MENKQIDMLNMLLIIVKYKRMIFWITSVISIIAVIYVLIAPQYWTSSATILPVESEKIGFTLGSTLLGAGASFLGSGIEESANNYITIMKSRMFSKKIMNKFDLQTYYEVENEDSLKVFDDIYRMMQKDVEIEFDAKFGTIDISITTKDKYLSADITDYYWQQLEQYNQNDRLTKGKQQRLFLEARVSEMTETIDHNMKLITQFKEENKAIELDVQTMNTISMYAELVTQKFTTEMELEQSSKYLPDNSPIINRLKNRISIIKNKISKIEKTEVNDRSEYIIGLDNIPSLSNEYAHLKMNLLINRQVYEFLYPQLENAKIEELKDLPTIEVIDKARPSGYRTKPKRARTCILMFFIGLTTSILFAFLAERINSIKKDSLQFALLNEIKNHLKFNK